MNDLKKYILPLFTLLFIYILNKSWNDIPPLGKFLDPFNGCWQNAIAESKISKVFTMPPLKDTVQVKFDERLVPHIFASTNEDAIFIQGYLHAQFRLWQMDMTARFAGGRLSEIIGKKTLKVDREMRRKGIVYAAQNSLQKMESDSTTKRILNAYTQGVNFYIHSLTYKKFPLEYKLMDFAPEEWTNLKTSLIIKFMADKLSGRTEDFELTMAKNILGNLFDQLYPERLHEEYPIVDEANLNSKPQCITINKNRNSGKDIKNSLANFNRTPANNIESLKQSIIAKQKEHHHSSIGSNNWVVSGSHTNSGKPILCNDPHLQLNLPSIWYENQLITPTMNVYGVSLPGAPQIVIGFTDSIAWGFTNGYRDVKDFYSIQFKDESKKAYLFNGSYIPSDLKFECIKIKGNPDFIDTVAYTKMGIVMYDHSFPRKGFEQQNFAMNWMAHRASNELKALTKLNKAKNYTEYVDAIQDFECPHQNIIFASASGDIALWSQGTFIQKKNQQGRFIEDGTTSNHQWQGRIPFNENPHILNPTNGIILSANQINTNKNYPYYYNGIFSEERAKRITHLLSEKKIMDVQDMMRIQIDDYWQNASEILPILLNNIQKEKLNPFEYTIYKQLNEWDFHTQATSYTPILYDLWFNEFEAAIYNDEFGTSLEFIDYPNERLTLQLVQSDSNSAVFDNINTSQKEKMSDIIQESFVTICKKYQQQAKQFWFQYKHTSAIHLSQIPAFSTSTIPIGGGHGIVNAASSKDGPSWRMIVHFTNPIEAYGIYPGGESGNVASPYYTNMMDNWAKGNYYKLQFAHNANDIK